MGGSQLGLTQIEVESEMDSQPINRPEDWWAMVLGSGYRGTIEQLTETERGGIKNGNFEFIIQRKIKSVEANVLHGQALK